MGKGQGHRKCEKPVIIDNSGMKHCRNVKIGAKIFLKQRHIRIVFDILYTF